MTRLTWIAQFACFIVVLPLVSACDDDSADTEATTQATSPVAAEEAVEIPEVSVDELATLIERNAAVPVDANSEGTRNAEGIIPGAKLLTSSGRYDAAAELPTDKATKLVFYCANEHCSASDGAAGRAIEAGYADVNVLRAGIAGWKAAGKATEALPAS
jgi:rhodanese-related sulfurtransferase